MVFQVYMYFGRVLCTFRVRDDETHHRAAEEARLTARDLEKAGTVCWVRLVRS